MIVPFPFKEIESVAPHVRTLPNFAWKPIVVQVEFWIMINSINIKLIIIYRMQYDVLVLSFMVIHQSVI